MSNIVLALVARGPTILVETHDPAHDNFLTAADTILSRIPPNSSKLSYVFQEWLFHYVSEEGVVFLCVANSEAGRRMPFAFLSELQKKFLATYEQDAIEEARAYGLIDFAGPLKDLVKRFNESPNSDPVRQAQAELAGVKDIMTQNVEQILSRGERIELLMDRTDQVSSQSLAFRRRAVGLRRQMWWRNVKVLGMAGFCAVVMIVILATAFSH